MRPLILIASALILTGCSSAQATPPTEPEPASNCVTVNEATQAALQAGIDIPDTTLTGYAATPSPSTDGLWYIAATYTGLDIAGEAVWITDTDPTTATTMTLMSVDPVAEAISNAPRLDGADVTAPGATASLDCLSK